MRFQVASTIAILSLSVALAADPPVDPGHLEVRDDPPAETALDALPVDAPATDFGPPLEVFEDALGHEKTVTASIHAPALARAARRTGRAESRSSADRSGTRCALGR